MATLESKFMIKGAVVNKVANFGGYAIYEKEGVACSDKEVLYIVNNSTQEVECEISVGADYCQGMGCLTGFEFSVEE